MCSKSHQMPLPIPLEKPKVLTVCATQRYESGICEPLLRAQLNKQLDFSRAAPSKLRTIRLGMIGPLKSKRLLGTASTGTRNIGDSGAICDFKGIRPPAFNLV